MKITVELTNSDLHDAIKAFVELKMKTPADGGVIILGIKEHTVGEHGVDFTATVQVDLESFF